MSDGEVIRPTQPQDVPALAALFLEAFGTDRPAEVWLWKYFAERPGVSFVCEAEGRIVAHCAGIPVRFRDGSRFYQAFQSVDFMSSPSYAGGVGGGGVFVRTVRHMFEKTCGPGRVELVYGFPGERHRMVGEKLLGYRPLEPIHELLLEPARSTVKPTPLTSAALRLFQRPRFAFGALRDRDYLEWRYLRHPIHRYAVLTVRGDVFRRRIAALVREVEDRFLLMEIGGSVSETAIRRLADGLRALGKPVSGWFSPQNFVGLSLLASGFTKVPREHWLEYRFFVFRERPVVGELYYTLGDYDVH